jgi:hypothetical protein
MSTIGTSPSNNGRGSEAWLAPTPCSGERLPVREQVRPAVGGNPDDAAAIEPHRVELEAEL